MKTKKIESPFLSIIIPLYNEQARLDNLSTVFEYFKNKKFKHEFILVNDGSTDNTLRKLNNLSKKLKFKLINYQENKGKGYAIRVGMIAAKGKFRLFTDIDLSTPLEELEKFIPHLNKYDLLIGSRKMKESNLKIRQPFFRENLGKGFTFLSQQTLGLNLSDFTCGFKIFSKKAAELIFAKQKLNRWGFDSEILFLAKKLNLKVREIPVTWSNDPKSKVRFPQDVFNSILDILRIRYYDLINLYNLK